MIEVTISNGDSAEADDPEAAIYAAQVLIREASSVLAYGSRLTASFHVDGRLVRNGVSLADLSLMSLANAQAAR